MISFKQGGQHNFKIIINYLMNCPDTNTVKELFLRRILFVQTVTSCMFCNTFLQSILTIKLQKTFIVIHFKSITRHRPFDCTLSKMR